MLLPNSLGSDAFKLCDLNSHSALWRSLPLWAWQTIHVCVWIEREGNECSLGPYHKVSQHASPRYHHNYSPLQSRDKAAGRPILQMGKRPLVLVFLQATQLVEKLQSI